MNLPGIRLIRIQGLMHPLGFKLTPVGNDLFLARRSLTRGSEEPASITFITLEFSPLALFG